MLHYNMLSETFPNGGTSLLKYRLGFEPWPACPDRSRPGLDQCRLCVRFAIRIRIPEDTNPSSSCFCHTEFES